MWEYEIVGAFMSPDELRRLLNHMGRLGWELVSAQREMLIMKRRLVSHSPVARRSEHEVGFADPGSVGRA
jgi:hypothetical protein